jgi:hypothetical protein
VIYMGRVRSVRCTSSLLGLGAGFKIHCATLQCDSSRLIPAENPYAYKARGDRCEGLYINQVASATLSLVSLTDFFEEYQLQSRHPLEVAWNGKEKTKSEDIRAQSAKRRLSYRMDTICRVNDRSFRRPLDAAS